MDNFISQKSTEYADSKLDKDCPYSKNVQRKERQFDWADIADAFEAGATWQKNHVWHKSDEKPDEHKLILETDGKGAFWLHATNYMPLDENTRWAYVEDLFLQTTAHF